MSNGGAGRVTIPAKVKRVIKNIQEIAGNHDDEEVYLMLKDCNMDPNETAQKLLSQDSFHEVRRKRDKRKENVKESTGSRRKPGMQDHGSRGERGNHSSRYIPHDAGQNFIPIKENGTNDVLEDKVFVPTLSKPQDLKNKKATDASLNFNVDTYAGVIAESKSVGHAVQTVAATSVDSTGSIPLLEDGVQSTEVIGPQKVLGPIKEWKRKHTNPSLPEGPDTTNSVEAGQVANQTTFGLEKKLEETCISDSRQVIIPKHIHVPEVEKLGFIFGSFDANFSLSTSDPVCSENERSSPILETSKGSEEEVDHSSNHNELMSVEDNNYPALPDVSESLISDAHDASSAVVQEYNEFKQETDLPPGYQQYSTVHAYPNYDFGIMPPMVASPVLPTDSTKSRGHDVSHLPAFVVQQPYDLNIYYAQFYRSGVDNEGRLSQSYEPALQSKVNGNVNVPPETPQSSQEGENTLILPTSASNSLVTQAAGIVPSSVATTHQAVPVFGQPAGLHLPHYPNYIPYLLPFYVPPPAIHHFLSTGVWPPPQHQVGSVYPAPGPADKYSVPQYKPGTTTVNTNDMASPGSYGPYSSTPASVSASSATTTGHSNSNEDLLTAQLKDNNLSVAGQQSEGPGVWFATPGRDISGLQANTFYNFPQAQMAFPATQMGHGNFAGIYHPAQPVTGAAIHPLLQQSQAMAGPIDMNGPAPSVYQPSQPAPINWPKNC